MKKNPMLFSTPMVQALLAGRKTQTRRLVKHPKNVPSDYILKPDFMVDKSIVWFQDSVYSNLGMSYDCPYGKPGDIIWVRETFRKYCKVDELGYTHYDQEVIEFAADNPPMINECDGDGCTMFKKDGTEKFIPWRPSIHMPKAIARIWLQVTSVKVERLQDISEQDALSEGIVKIDYGVQTPQGSASIDGGKTFHPFKPQQVFGYSENPSSLQNQSLKTARTAFGNLWERINGPESWQANPWVWCVSFKVLSTTGHP